jgi:hypothetical protein
MGIMPTSPAADRLTLARNAGTSNLQSANIEFTMKRLREPIEG